jgi:hypothetical protein
MSAVRFPLHLPALILTIQFFPACSPDHSPDVSQLLNGSGTIVDNGGDKLTCRSGGSNPFQGDYTLDHIVTYDPTLGFQDDPQLPDWASHRARVETFLAEKLPAALPSFRSYADLLGSSDDAQARIWKASALGLTDLRDEGLIQQLPDHCLRTTSDGVRVPAITQMVRRREVTTASTRKIFYYYDHAEFEQMKRDLPLQASYLIVHEWLWDFTNSPWVNRTINRLIHSKKAESMSRSDFEQHLKSLGVQVDGAGRPGPSGALEDQLERSFRANPVCNYDDRFTVELQRFDRVNRIVLEPGDKREFKVTVPADLLPAPDWKACGFGLMMTHQATSDGSSQLAMKLWRGVSIPFDRSFQSGSTPRQNYFHGQCDDHRCLRRSGELQDVVTPANFGNSRWNLAFTNNGSATVELLAPYFVFAGMTPTP